MGDLIDFIDKVGPTVVAIVATVAAFKAASAAKESAQNAAAIPRRALIRDVASTAEQIVDWVQATEIEIEQWKAQHISYCAMVGAYHSGSRIDVQNKIGAKLAEVGVLRTEADAINRDSPDLYAASDDDLSIKLGKLTASLDKLHRIYQEATAALRLLEAKAEAERDRRQRELAERSREPR